MASRNGAGRDAGGGGRRLRKTQGWIRVRVVMVFPTQRAVTTAAYRQLGALGDICNIVGIRNEGDEAKTSVMRLRAIRALKFTKTFEKRNTLFAIFGEHNIHYIATIKITVNTSNINFHLK